MNVLIMMCVVELVTQYLQGFLKANISVLGPNDDPVDAPYHDSDDADIEA